MTTPPSAHIVRDAHDTTRKSAAVSKAAFWIDDPVGSVITGIVFPAAAIGLAVASIWTLTLTVS